MSHVLNFAGNSGSLFQKTFFFLFFINADVPWVYRQFDAVFPCDTSPIPESGGTPEKIYESYDKAVSEASVALNMLPLPLKVIFDGEEPSGIGGSYDEQGLERSFTSVNTDLCPNIFSTSYASVPVPRPYLCP